MAGSLLAVERSWAGCRGDSVKDVSWRVCWSFQKVEPFLTSPSVWAQGKCRLPSSAHLACIAWKIPPWNPSDPPGKHPFLWWRLTKAVSSPSFYGWEEFEEWGGEYTPAVTLQVGGRRGSQSEACQLGALLLVLRIICNVYGSNTSMLCLWSRRKDCYKNRQSSFRADIIIIPTPLGAGREEQIKIRKLEFITIKAKVLEAKTVIVTQTLFW